MLVAVKTPRIEIEMKGDVPEKYIELLKADFGDNVSVSGGADETVDVFETDWYKEESAAMKPGDVMRTYRKIHGLTQKVLAEKLNIAVQTVSNMETGIRPVSRSTAYALADIFKVPAGRFI